MNWRLLLGGMAIWALHSFALYGIGSIWHSGMNARLLTGLMTLLCLAGEGWLLTRIWRQSGDHLDAWMRHLSLALIALASLAILWQAFPALLS